MALLDSEIEYIKKELGREPNSLEEGMLDVMFSEHCSYKSSRPILSLFPNEGDNVIVGPGDDAAIISVTDELGVAVALESHNHPSALEPFSGAGTGVGGIVRDIISMGAEPVAVLDSFRFGKLDDERPLFIFENAIKGGADYSNTIEVPIISGELEFDDSYSTNPLVNVLCAGIVKKDEIMRGTAPNVGDVFLLMGAGTGRDGIHGVTFASEELTEDSEDDTSAVALGDPHVKKRIIAATMEIYEKFDVSGVKDLGGGGLTCCVSEMVADEDNGAVVDINKIFTAEDNMTPYEKMLSESQERMVFVISPDIVDGVMSICSKHDVDSAIVGEVVSGENLVIKDGDDIIADISAKLLADPPVIKREIKAPVLDESSVEVKHPEVKEALEKILSSPNKADQGWIYKQCNSNAQGKTLVAPGDDAGVIKADEKTAIIMSLNSNTLHSKLNPYNGGAGSLTESIRNVVAMGGKPYAVVDGLNFGNPEIPENLWEFEQSVKGIADVAKANEIPVVGGNVSLYNETDGVKINPTPVIGVIGVGTIDEIKTLPFKDEGDKIILVGKTYSELDGSEYHRTIHGLVKGKAPEVRVSDEISNINAILSIMSNENITSIHNVSSGGIAVALAEMAASSDLGAKIDIDAIDKDLTCSKEDELFETLFSESYGRLLLTVKPEEAENILKSLGDISATIIGEVKGDSLIFNDAEIAISDIKENYYNQFEKYVG